MLRRIKDACGKYGHIVEDCVVFEIDGKVLSFLPNESVVLGYVFNDDTESWDDWREFTDIDEALDFIKGARRSNRVERCFTMFLLFGGAIGFIFMPGVLAKLACGGAFYIYCFFAIKDN